MMKTLEPAFLLLLALAVCSPLAAAAAVQERTGAPGKPVEASAKVPPLKLDLAVSGLAEERSETVRKALLALTTRIHACPPCGVEAPAKGKCSGCGASLVEVERELFTAAELSTKDGRIVLTVTPMATLRLSRLRGLLEKNEVELDDERLRLGGRARLVVDGPPSGEPAAVAKALTDADLFEEVTVARGEVARDEEDESVVLDVRGGSRPPTVSEVSAALGKAGAGLVDVIWPPRTARS
jgi:hypothetical protein